MQHPLPASHRLASWRPGRGRGPVPPATARLGPHHGGTAVPAAVGTIRAPRIPYDA